MGNNETITLEGRTLFLEMLKLWAPVSSEGFIANTDVTITLNNIGLANEVTLMDGKFYPKKYLSKIDFGESEINCKYYTK